MDQQLRNLSLHKSERAIAEEHGVSIDGVLAVLDQHPIQVDRDRYLKRTLAKQLLALDELEVTFRQKALDGDVASGCAARKGGRTQGDTARA